MLSKNDLNKAEEVKPQKGNSEDETEVEMEDAVQKVCNTTGCSVSVKEPFCASCSNLLNTWK